MTEIVLVKRADGALVPADQEASDLLVKVKPGEAARATIKRARNLKHHRKMMALLRLAFDGWEPGELEYKGEPVEKNFERFRHDIVILAGYYTQVANIRGEVRFEARSLNFASMGQDEFAELYDKVVTVILRRVLTTYKREDVDEVVEKILNNFA